MFKRNHWLKWSIVSIKILSASVLFIWYWHPAFLQPRQPNYFGCNPITALSFILLASGFSTVIRSPKLTMALVAFSSILGLLSLLKLAEIVLPLSFLIDQLLFHSVLKGTYYSYPAAVCFLLFSVLLLLHALDYKPFRPFLLLLLIPVYLICLNSWFGFVLSDPLSVDTHPFAPLSLITTFQFTVSIIICVRLFPDKYLIPTVFSPRLGGIISRRLLPWLLLIPLLILLDGKYGERHQSVPKILRFQLNSLCYSRCCVW